MGEVSSAAALNASLQYYWSTVFAESPSREKLGAPIPITDVRDMAEAHVLALEKEKAGGERIFVIGGTYVWQDLRE